MLLLRLDHGFRRLTIEVASHQILCELVLHVQEANNDRAQKQEDPNEVDQSRAVSVVGRSRRLIVVDNELAFGRLQVLEKVHALLEHSLEHVIVILNLHIENQIKKTKS